MCTAERNWGVPEARKQRPPNLVVDQPNTTHKTPAAMLEFQNPEENQHSFEVKLSGYICYLLSNLKGEATAIWGKR
jgi:hypothetical protein